MSRIIKSPYVYIDMQNKVELEAFVPQPQHFPEETDDDFEGFTPISLTGFDEKVEEEPEPEPEISPEEQAEEILERARVQAQEIINEANREAQQIHDVNMQMINQKSKEIEAQSRNIGRQEGYNEGISQAQALKYEAESVLQNAYAQRDQIISSIEPEMVDLITNIIGKLLPDISILNPQVILCLIKQGLSGSSIAGEVVVHVSKDDYDYVIENKDAILMMLDTQSKLDIVMDLALSKSDCIIETPFGNIDCSLDRQYSELVDNLHYILNNRLSFDN